MMAAARRAALFRISAAAGLVGAAWVALGRPDLDGAAEFFTGTWPTDDTERAAVSVLLWLIVAALVAAELRSVWRTVSGTPPRWPARRGALILLVGLAVFAGGYARHQVQVRTLCCGSVERAAALAR